MFRCFCLAFALTLLCVNPALAKKFPPPPSPLAQDLPVELVLNQQELAVDVAGGNSGAAGGVIGVLIVAGINNDRVKDAEARVVPIRDLFIDYPFNDRFEAALRAKIKTEGISPNPILAVLPTTRDAVDASGSQSVPLHVLVITPHYAFDRQFEKLLVKLDAQILDREIKSNGKIKKDVAFRRVYTFNFTMDTIAGKDNAQRWAAMGKARLAEMLDQGIAQTTDMLVHDFSSQGRAEWGRPTKPSATVKGKTYAGMPLRQTPEWVWVRVGKDHRMYENMYGDLMAEAWIQRIEGYQPVNEYVAGEAVAPVAPSATGTATPAGSAVDGAE